MEGQYAYAEVRTIDDIISDFEWALKDPDIKAIFYVRGGYGASEIMDLTSLDMIKEADKPIIGYSDITIYHSAWAVSGLPSLPADGSGNFGNERGGKFESVADGSYTMEWGSE